jgi:hypothetical protein
MLERQRLNLAQAKPQGLPKNRVSLVARGLRLRAVLPDATARVERHRMRDNRPEFWIVLSALLAGCVEPAADAAPPQYVASEVPGYSTDECRVNGNLMMDSGFAERTPLGFSGQDVVAAFNEHAAGTLIWDGDESATPLLLQVVATPESVTSSGDVPRYQSYCVPMLEVRDVMISARTLDGRLDEEVSAEIVGMSDGRGGISAFFLTQAAMQPRTMRGNFEPPAELMREGEIATLSIDFSWSHDGMFRAHCADGMPISDDPSEACSAYPGRLRFTSRPADNAGAASFSPADYVDLALARIEAR